MKGLLLAAGERPGMLLNVPQSQHSSSQKNHLAPNVSSAKVKEVEEPCFKDFSARNDKVRGKLKKALQIPCGHEKSSGSGAS